MTVVERAEARPNVPWSMSEAGTAFSTTVLGAGLLAWAWWETSGTADLDRQTTWTIVGILALVVIASGSFYWLVSGRRAVRARRDRLADRLEDSILVSGDGPAAGTTAGAARRVAVTGTSRYHRPECLLVRGKETRAVTARTRLTACEMCEP